MLELEGYERGLGMGWIWPMAILHPTPTGTEKVGVGESF